MGLQSVSAINDWDVGTMQARATVTVPPRHSGWMRFEFRHPVDPHRLYRLEWSAGPGLWAGVQAKPPIGVNRGFQPAAPDAGWRPFSRLAELGHRRGAFLMRLAPEARPYAADNVVTGINRPEAWTHLWMSDPRQPLPQWIELKLPHPVDIASVHLTFDDDLDTNIYLPSPWGRLGQGPPPPLVADYGVLALTAGGWRRLADAAGNYQRHRVHHVAGCGVRAVRVECRATHGAPEARLYEIRIYGGEKEMQP